MSMPNPLRVNIIGAGVIGLSIACELLDRGATVTVISDAAHPYDCSPLAGAVWFPYGVSLEGQQVHEGLVAEENLPVGPEQGCRYTGLLKQPLNPCENICCHSQSPSLSPPDKAKR